MAEDPSERRRWSRGFVFHVLLCAYLTVTLGYYVMVIAVNWGDGSDQNAAISVTAVYVATIAILLLGLYLPGQGGTRDLVRRALVLVPSGAAGGALVAGVLMGWDDLGWLPWSLTAYGLFELFWKQIALYMLGGCVLGALLVAITRRVPLGKLFARSWLVLTVVGGAANAAAYCAYRVCSARGGILPGLEAAFGMITTWVVLSWSVAFGLAVGATRHRNAAPAGPPDGQIPAEPPRDER